ncbi:protein tpr3 [Fagus crenata]
MADPSRDILYRILQFLDSENLKETARTLERESGFYFNMRFFEDLVLNGGFDEAEEYLYGFTDVHDNMYSTKIIFEIRKQKFLETLDDGDRTKALRLLMNEFKDFEPYNETLCREASALLTLDDFRNHESLADYGDIEGARRLVMDDIRRCIELNPTFQGKLQFPNIDANLRRRLIMLGDLGRPPRNGIGSGGGCGHFPGIN